MEMPRVPFESEEAGEQPQTIIKYGVMEKKKFKIWGGHPNRPKNFSKKFFLPLGMIFQGLSNKPLYVSVAITGR